MNSEDTRNLILAIVLSAIVLIGWNYFFAPAPRPAPNLQAAATAGAPSALPQNAAPALAVPKPRSEALAENPRLAIDGPSVGGSINLVGARLDDLFLKGYRESISPNSPQVMLFSPAGSVEPYWAETGFVSADKSVATPNRTTKWQAGDAPLSPGHPATLTFDNGAGLIFTREIALDDKFMFTLTDKVENKTDKPVSLRPYALVLKDGAPKPSGSSVFEGLIAYADGAEQRDTYAALEKETDRVKPLKSTGGWFGFTDRYWAAAVIPPQDQPVDARFSASGPAERPIYQSDYLSPVLEVAPGATAAQTTHVFAGALDVSAIDTYVDKLGVKKLDLLIDWGRLYFVTKPMFYLIDFIYKIVGHFWAAILLVTVVVKAVFFPLANQSFRSMAKMKTIQPKIAALKEQYPNDPQKQQQAQMALMKQEGVNPVAGCLPMLPQIPVFIALYSVFSITLEMRHQPFFGWIHDLSVPDPSNVFNLFGLIPFDPTALPGFGHFLHLGVWPLLMGVTMFLQMKMQPEPTDPTQKTMFTLMPLIFTFTFASFPAGLVIYYAWNNTLTLLQQSLIMKRAGARIELFDNLRNMFRSKQA